MAKHIGEHCLPRTWVAWSESEVKRQPVLYRQFKVNLCYIFFLVSQRIIENKIACPAGNAISSVSFLCLPCLVISFVSKKNTNFYLISEVRKPEPLETGCYFDSRRPERTKARKFSLFDHGKSISLSEGAGHQQLPHWCSACLFWACEKAPAAAHSGGLST